jgi:nicotinamidase/pyrazinamidase
MVEDASAGIDIPAAGLLQAETKKRAIKSGIQYVTTADIVSPRQL